MASPKIDKLQEMPPGDIDISKEAKSLSSFAVRDNPRISSRGFIFILSIRVEDRIQLQLSMSPSNFQHHVP